MAFLPSLDISGSGLSAQKFRMNLISQNIANAQTTRTENGEAYRRKLAVFSENRGASFQNVLSSASARTGKGVSVTAVAESENPFKPVYDPDHPDADENGYVMMPNISTVEEMVDMISATRSYEANVTAFNAVKQMALKALEIGR